MLNIVIVAIITIIITMMMTTMEIIMSMFDFCVSIYFNHMNIFLNIFPYTSYIGILNNLHGPPFTYRLLSWIPTRPVISMVLWLYVMG